MTKALIVLGIFILVILALAAIFGRAVEIYFNPGYSTRNRKANKEHD